MERLRQFVRLLGGSAAAGAGSDEFEPVAGDRETMGGAQAGDRIRLERTRQVEDAAAFQAARVRVRLGAGVVACRLAAAVEFCGESAANEGFEGLVDGCEGNVREVCADRREDVISRRMCIRGTKISVHGSALLRVAVAAVGQCLAQPGLGTRMDTGWRYGDRS